MESLNTETTTPTRSPPQQNQPDLKKTKLSSDDNNNETTLNTNTNVNDPEATKRNRYKRRKIAIFFGYCGVGYQGMQKNPGAKTIEGEFEEALYRSGAVPEEERGAPRRYDWARSARTDKGVSAVVQVVSGRFFVDPPGFIDRLNGNLPDQIRIFGFKRTTPSFNAKKFCDRRRYVYLLPVFALDPSSCFATGEESVVVPSLGLGNIELVKCCNSGFETEKAVVVDSGHSLNGNDGMSDSEIDSVVKKEIEGAKIMSNSLMKSLVSQSGNGNGSIMSELGSKVKEELKDEFMDDAMGKNADETIISAQNEACLDTSTREGVKEEKNSVDAEEQPVKKEKFTYGEREKERFNRILKYYVGTHNFHNFTSRTTAEDPSAKRYIVSFDANTTVTVEGIEFVKCEVVGQSFMLHQIRNMIGLAVAIMRNCAPESLIETAFKKDVKINMPMAPEVGLYLDECFFTSYNKKWKKTHEEVSMKSYEEAAEDFKMKYIYSHIASTEHKEGVVAHWLRYINHRDYPDLRFDDSRETVEVKDMCNATVEEVPGENVAEREKMARESLEENDAGEEKMTVEIPEENILLQKVD